MSGFPTRISRSALGPTPQNRYPVTNPSKYLDAGIGDLLFWQLSGLNIVSPRAYVVFTGATAAYVSGGMAWDPNNAQPRPTISRTSAGVYVVTWLANYPDKDSASVATSLLAARAFAQQSPPLLAAGVVRADGHTVDVSVTTAGGVGTDSTVWLEVL